MIPRGATAVLLLLTVTQGCWGIRCYECVHNSQRMKRQQRFVYPCSEFDGTERYVRDCPDSELCIHQHITLQLAAGSISVHTMDGCTPNSTQLTRYSEAGLVRAGCIQHLSRYRPPSSIYCYCDYNLCNERRAGGKGREEPRVVMVLLLPLLLLLLLRLQPV